MSIIGFKKIDVAKYLATGKEHPIKVPKYQRDYEWEDDQINDLWEDILYLKENKEIQQHFFGQLIIYNTNTKEKEIIDGQQRTITSLILISCIQDIMLEYKNINLEALDFYNYISNNFIGSNFTKKITEDDLYFKSKSVFFTDFIQLKKIKENQVNSDKLNQSDKKIYNAYNFFKNKIKDHINNKEDPFKELINIYNLFTNSFEFLMIETNDFEEAYIIFETVNDRGLDLTLDNLVKSHILRTARNRFDEILSMWLNIENNMKNESFSKYIEYYWKTIDHKTPSKRIYKSIKTHINKEELAFNFVHNLNNYYPLYKYLENPYKKTYQKKANVNHKINNLIQGIDLLYSNRKNDLNRYYIPLMITLSKVGVKEDIIYQHLKQYELYLFKAITISKISTSTLSNFIYKYCEEINIYGFSDKLFKKYTDFFKNQNVSDELFIIDFGKNSFKNLNILKYIFVNYENYLSNSHIEYNDVSIVSINKESHTLIYKYLANHTIVENTIDLKKYDDPFNAVFDSDLTLNNRFKKANTKYKTTPYMENFLKELSKIAPKIWDQKQEVL